ncbi:MAG TPA: RIP metalloprotease RseP [Gemmatimonadaceae bacterium]|nr:RIP metalloprotease RseP [Gemmatimonadaceae bacterium]
MLAILAPILVFGLVIFVHELGHFLAAKALGVYTPRFSIGFGPPLWKRRRGETEYILAALPLGGYVRMASRHDETAAALEGGSETTAARNPTDPDYDANAMIPFGPKPVPEHRWFESKPLWARMIILLAGVTMNFVLGLVVAIGLSMHFGKIIVPTREVGSVRPVNGQPLLSGIQPGDSLRAINGHAVRSWSDAMEQIARADRRLEIETNRTRVNLAINQPGAPSAEDVAVAIDYAMPPVIEDVIPGEVAARAGFQGGDSVVAIDGAPVHTWSEMVLAVARRGGQSTRFDVVRGHERRTITATPKPTKAIDPASGEDATVGKIGAIPVDVTSREPVSVGEAVRIGSRTAWFMGTSIIGTVRDLMTRKVSVDQLGGPIAITRASVQAARTGFESLFSLIALLSINVAILNLLPIPILDGGQILINVLESLRGHPFSLRTREYILRGGLFVILLLFVLVMFNDTRGLFR